MFSVWAQADTLIISRTDAENLFLEKNFELISQRLNIEKAEAEIIQAKIWPNPTFTINEVNLWTNGKKHVETQPYLFGKWGKTTQFALELEQRIQTASKRKKLVEAEKVNKEISLATLEEITRNLKYDFRKTISDLQYLQKKERLFQKLSHELQNLIKGFQNQLNQRNINKSEVVRLQSLYIQFSKEINEIQKEKNQNIQSLKVWMSLDPNVYLIIDELDFKIDKNQFEELNQLELIQISLENRSDYKINQLEGNYFLKKLIYEKSLRIPDLEFSVNYDRGGGIMRDFVGFGLSFDLPFFDRNQGNIQLAQIEIQQNEIEQTQKQLEIQSEVKKQLDIIDQTYFQFAQFDEEFENDLDSLLPAYHQNFLSRNLSLLEFIDFIESYIESKEILLDYQLELKNHFEELQYIIGKEI